MNAGTELQELLLFGQLPPAASQLLRSRFRVHEAAALEDVPPALRERLHELRAVAIGEVWRGHPPGVVINEDFMSRFAALEILAVFGTGYEHIDRSAARELGITVTHTPGAVREEVADLAMGLLLCTVRQLPQAHAFACSGQWDSATFPLTASLQGRRLGIYGMGKIGTSFARRAEAFGLDIAYHNRKPVADSPYKYYSRLQELAGDVDILVALAPGGEATRFSITEQVLEALGPDGYLILVSRGSLVDDAVLIDALQRRLIRGAGIDAYSSEPHIPAALREMQHVVLLPHIGSGTDAAREAMGRLVVDNLVSWFAGHGPITAVPQIAQ